MILRHLMFASDPECNNSGTSSECTDEHSVGLSLKALSLGIIFIVSMAMNGTVCLVFYKKNQLLTVSNTFVLNLICCQLALSILVLPFTLTSVFSAKWIFNETWCHIQGFILTFCISVTQFTLTVIAVDRNYAIINSLRYPYVFTQKRGHVVIGLTFAVSVVLSIPPLAGLGKYRYWSDQNTCSIDWTYSVEFSITFLTVTFILPLFIQSWCYLTIFKAAMNHTKRNTRVYPSTSTTTRERTSFSSESTDVSNTRTQVSYKSMECKAMRTILFIAVTYAVCWVPYLFCAVNGILGNDLSYDLGSLAIVMIFLNTSIDPLIYAFMNRLMRFEIYKFYCDSLNKISSKSSTYNESDDISASQSTSRHSTGGKVSLKSRKGGLPVRPIDMNTIHEESEPSTPDLRQNKPNGTFYREIVITPTRIKSKKKTSWTELNKKAEVQDREKANNFCDSERKPSRSRSEIWSSRDSSIIRDRESFLFFDLRKDKKSSTGRPSTASDRAKIKSRIKTVSEQTNFTTSTFIQDDNQFSLDDLDITAQLSIDVKRKRKSALPRQPCEPEHREYVSARNCLSA